MVRDVVAANTAARVRRSLRPRRRRRLSDPRAEVCGEGLSVMAPNHKKEEQR